MVYLEVCLRAVNPKSNFCFSVQVAPCESSLESFKTSLGQNIQYLNDNIHLIKKKVFTITAEILARSLGNFYCQ